MPLQWPRRLLFVAALIASGSAWTSDALVGEWDGFIESPERPIHINVGFRRVEGAWSGTMNLLGRRGLTLEGVSFEPPRVQFQVQINGDRITFEGKLAGEQISGTARVGTEAFPFWLERALALPPPANRAEAWQQDLDVALEKFLRYDRSFTPEDRGQFCRVIAGLKASVAKRSDPEIIVLLARAVALSGNAHTRLYLLHNRTELRRFPIRVWWFADGLYVVKATPEHRALLGCRVQRIGGHDVKQLKEKVTELFAGNDSWKTYMSVYFLTSPEILYGLGVIADMEHVNVEAICNGQSVTGRLLPLPLKRKDRPTEAWWDLSPFAPDEDQAWASALDPDPPGLPLYLRRPHQYYWFDYLEERGVVYFQYNRSQNMPAGERFTEFSARLLQFLAGHPVRALVVDLRFNTGGDNGIARQFFRGLGKNEKINQRGRLFVITGRATFSAGITHAAELKQFTDAILVGEPVGDVLDFWAEGGNLTLPHSKLTLHFSNGYHNYSRNERPEFQPYFQNLDIDTLKPDILIQLSSQDYFAGHDPALAAILTYPAK